MYYVNELHSRKWKGERCRWNPSIIVARILKRNKFIEIEKLTEIVLESRKANPYLYSIENEKLSFVQFLWNFVVDKNPLVRRDLSVFHLSAEKGRRIIVRYFLQHFCDKNPSNFGNIISMKLWCLIIHVFQMQTNLFLRAQDI